MPTHHLDELLRARIAYLVAQIFGLIGVIAWSVFLRADATASMGYTALWPWLGLVTMLALVIAASRLIDRFLLEGTLLVLLGTGFVFIGLIWLAGPGSSADLPLEPRHVAWNIVLLDHVVQVFEVGRRSLLSLSVGKLSGAAESLTGVVLVVTGTTWLLTDLQIRRARRRSLGTPPRSDVLRCCDQFDGVHAQ